MYHLTPKEQEIMAKALRRSVRVVRNKECAWRDERGENWRTSCGNRFVLIDGTPSDNNMKFCCYCGGLLKTPPVKDTGQ